VKHVQLNAAEIAALMEPDTTSGGNLGWDSLLVRLQADLNQTTGDLPISDSDLERLARYAFDHGKSEWEARLTTVFARHLGPKLGRA
jgi:hypothetical protein